MSDATPAYRGYRLQTLYALARILEADERADLVFQPEGAEDLAIWDTSDRLLEAVQVKAKLSVNLNLSSLAPEKCDSFCYRVSSLLSKNSQLKITIASFGEIGAEFLHATQVDGQKRQNVAKKIAKHGFLSEADATILLNQLQIDSVVESELEERVFNALRNSCTGIDPLPAFEMLNFWLYLCAENKRKIAQNDIIQRINDVGRFIAEREAHHSEWFRAIVPIENVEVDAQTQDRLSNEFYRGISARYEHILAGVDKPRISKINEIYKKFKEQQVVIVHGASGQGKTTIAYRYLHDFFPDRWRFQVKLVENRQQAVNIATALSGQAKAIGIPIAVYLDVSPNDVGWYELVKQLSLHKNIQILVTVREEDFRRASISGAEIQFAEVELQFDRLEAEEIYQFLGETETPDRFLNFEDAWNRFGGNGPLMEFVYLVTQGDSLRERLQQQIRRIQDEVRAGKGSDAELKLLRLVSVASAFEARLKLKELVHFLQLPSPQRTLELLEKEYLLRISENGTLVGGLHPIRSTILANILTDPTFSPWAESASICLPFIFEQDVGSFLLYAFSRHRLELEPLLSALNTYQPRQWIAIAGVTRALIWLGVKEYVEANRQLIQDAYQFANHGWALIVDFDITDASPGSTEGLLSTLMRVLHEDQQAQINALRKHQTDKIKVFARATMWLSQLNDAPIPPQFELEWVGMAEVLFWVGRLQISLPISDWLAHVNLDSSIEILPLEILADVALGLFYGHEEGYGSWLKKNYGTLLSRFRRETQTVVWEDDGQNLRTHFIIELFQPNSSPSEAESRQKDIEKRFLNASMERLELLRRLLPDRERYGSQGYGHLIGIGAELPDDTRKNIPRSNFPLQWLVSINSTFKALGEQDLRPDTWESYTKTVVELRQTNLKILQQLSRGLEIYFRKKKKPQILGKIVKPNLWKRGRQLLERSPWLPRCAFDEWGFITENIDRTTQSSDPNFYDPQNLALEKYKKYVKAFNEYVRTCSNFFKQAEWVLNFNSKLRDDESDRVKEFVRREADIDLEKQAHLSVVNLGDAWKSIPKLQEEFRKLLSPFLMSEKLDELERLEREIFNSIWYLWYFFAFKPNSYFQNAQKKCTQQFTNKVREIKSNIKKELKSISSDDVQVSILSDKVRWEEERSLWLTIDGEDAFEVYEMAQAAVSAIQRAINSVYSNELRRYAIDFTWSNIALVPLVQGKSLNATAWRFSSILFSVDTEREFNQWNYLQVAIPSNAFSLLKLSKWEHPRLRVAEKLVVLISQLSRLLSPVNNFEQLPDLDEQGHELLQPYIQQIDVPLGEAFQAVLDIETEVANYWDALSPSEQISRSDLLEAVKILIELRQQILPTADCSRDGNIEVTMNLTQMSEWASRLSAARQNVSLMYLFWATDVLQH